MNKTVFALSIIITSFSVLVGSPNAFAVTETVFEENFDGTLVDWSESLCTRNSPPDQTCRIGQATTLRNPPNDLANSLPNWGFVEIEANGGHVDIPVEVRYQKSFNVVTTDNYDVSAWLGITDCSGCNITTRLFIDGVMVLEKIGPNLDAVPAGSHKSFEQATFHLTSGTRNIEMTMYSTGAIGGIFRASFDDIRIERDIVVPLPVVTCGTGTTLNVATNTCEADPVASLCDVGTTLNVATNKCEADVTQSQLDTCNIDLGSNKTALASATSSLNTCNTDLGTAQASLTNLFTNNQCIPLAGTIQQVLTCIANLNNQLVLPSISIDDVSKNEGREDKKTDFTFTITRSGNTSSSSSVNYATSDGTAKNTDYKSKSGTVIFAAGETTKTVTIEVKGDNKIEPNETFNVNLSIPIGCTITDNLGIGTIINDD